jgi:hypothetical protein
MGESKNIMDSMIFSRRHGSRGREEACNITVYVQNNISNMILGDKT